jgi:hypothetical protein
MEGNGGIARHHCTGASRTARDRWNHRRNTMAIFFPASVLQQWRSALPG